MVKYWQSNGIPDVMSLIELADHRITKAPKERLTTVHVGITEEAIWASAETTSKDVVLRDDIRESVVGNLGRGRWGSCVCVWGGGGGG